MNLVLRSCVKLRRRRVRSGGSMRIGRRLFGCAVRRELMRLISSLTDVSWRSRRMRVFGTYQGASTIMRRFFDWKRSSIKRKAAVSDNTWVREWEGRGRCKNHRQALWSQIMLSNVQYTIQFYGARILQSVEELVAGWALMGWSSCPSRSNFLSHHVTETGNRSYPALNSMSTWGCSRGGGGRC
jgi:hypothetical protein